MNEEPQNAEVQILEAARSVFSRKGKDGARMQEIADLAGVNKAMLHYYYRSKDGLYGAVLADVWARFMGQLATALERTDTFHELLRHFVDAHLGFVSSHPEVVRLLLHENLAGAPVLKELVALRRESGQAAPPDQFAERVRQAVEAGEIRPVHPLHAFMSLLGACVFPFIAQSMVRGIHPDVDTHAPAFVEDRKVRIVDLLYNGFVQP